MGIKITSIIMLFVFMCFNFSCTSVKQINLVNGESWDQSGKVTTVFTRSGDLIEFSNLRPATMVMNKIVGTVFDKTGVPKNVSIPLSEVEVVWVKKFSPRTFLAPLAVLGVLSIYAVIMLSVNHV